MKPDPAQTDLRGDGGTRWLLRGFDEEAARRLARSLGVPPLVAGLLAARGVRTEEEARALLRPGLGQLHDPSLMLGMERAAARVLRAALDRGAVGAAK